MIIKPIGLIYIDFKETKSRSDEEMSLTRSFLKALGLNEEQVNSIVEGHTETLSAYKEELKAAKEKADRLDRVEKELNDLKAANSGKEDFKPKYEAAHAELEKLKFEIAAKETKAAKETALKAYFEKKNIVGRNLSIAMRGIKSELDGIELDEKGNIKDTASLDELVKGDYAGLISTTKTEGANTSTPPANIGGGAKTREEIIQIKDTEERQAAWAEYLGIGAN